MADDPGVTAPPAEPAAPAAPAAEPAPNGSEPVTNPGSNPEQTVPFNRFQQANDRAKKAEEELEALRAQQPAPPSDDGDEIEPDVEKLLDNYAKKRGLVSKEELAAERTKIQVQQDVKELEAVPPVAGVPYNHQAVLDYANTNGIPITSRSALKAAYKELNWDKIVEAERQKAIEGYKTAGSSGAERPSSPGALPPEEPKLTGTNPKERTRERIRLARQKLNLG